MTNATPAANMHTSERFPSNVDVTEADYFAAYFAALDDAPMEDTPAALEECIRRTALYWSPEVARARRMVRAIAIHQEFGE